MPLKQRGLAWERKLADEHVAAIKAAPNESAAALARRLGIAAHYVYYWRAKLKKEAGVRRIPVVEYSGGGAPPPVVLDRALACSVDGKAAGVAQVAPAIDAKAPAVVRLELSLDEARGLLAKLTEAQGVAFFEAGLRAALLA